MENKIKLIVLFVESGKKKKRSRLGADCNTVLIVNA